MADKQVKVEIVTPERIVFSEEVEFVVVPGEEGYLGILANHAPIVAALKIGVMKVIQNQKEIKLAISGGFMEVSKNKLVVLADTAERGDEIDVARARAAKERAEQRLASRTHDIDLVRAELALRRAIARIKAAGYEV
ncbi:ATP synthase F1 subunit epsilon [Thermincola ferriacetica]|uniref:ATP synthase epsilon chain n=1 Tax=Thermincola ferriacetica TaxID=281456 RepID=A0A0L6VZ59_9FIRM|nr:F0F1 ATP synthase subunit epsilon [Thermincola ferriacetica]KNZ68413.1 ATP synthase F1 subunit epsilon [Thermincola ferriacetica]